jgi:chemotaxis methyl-accepting protein methylase
MSGNALPDDTEGELNEIFRLLSATGIDFTFYKHCTIKRSIKRRMALRRCGKMEDYIGSLRHNHAEASTLCQDFFVTQFFRDPSVFAELKEKVFPALAESRTREDPIRISVPGCAASEEAYSIAMCLMEFLDGAAIGIPVQVLAMDVGELAKKLTRRLRPPGTRRKNGSSTTWETGNGTFRNCANYWKASSPRTRGRFLPGAIGITLPVSTVILRGVARS